MVYRLKSLNKSPVLTLRRSDDSCKTGVPSPTATRSPYQRVYEYVSGLLCGAPTVQPLFIRNDPKSPSELAGRSTRNADVARSCPQCDVDRLRSESHAAAPRVEETFESNLPPPLVVPDTIARTVCSALTAPASSCLALVPFFQSVRPRIAAYSTNRTYLYLLVQGIYYSGT